MSNRQKMVNVSPPGGGEGSKLQIEPGTTAEDIIEEMGKDSQEYGLRKGNEENFFPNNADVYKQVEDGDGLYIATPAEAGGKSLFSSFLPNSSGRGSNNVKEVGKTKKSHDPKDSPFYLKKNGWRKKRNLPETWIGKCRGRRTRKGKIVRHRFKSDDFFIHRPTKRFRRKAHKGRCLTHLGGGWYKFHFRNKPDAVGDGIEKMEGML